MLVCATYEQKIQLLAIQNPMVDVDKRVLVSRIEAFGFTALPTALAEIDRRAAAAATAFDFKAAMDLLRAFFESFMQEVAAKVAAKYGTAAPVPGAKGISYFGTFKEYLQNAGLLQKDEAEMLQSLYKYLSNTASHRLGSAPELFHVARTTVIEWCLLIAGRVQAYTS